MANPYIHNTCYPYPNQLPPHKKTSYYDNHLISYPSCPSFLPPQYPPYAPPYWFMPNSCNPCQNSFPNYYPNYYPNYLDATQDEFSPPQEIVETDIVESEDCDSIPLHPPSPKPNSNTEHHSRHSHKHEHSDSDDNSTICSSVADDDTLSIGNESTMSSSKHKPKDVFFLRIPKMKNKNVRITMNQNEQNHHPHYPYPYQIYHQNQPVIRHLPPNHHQEQKPYIIHKAKTCDR